MAYSLRSRTVRAESLPEPEPLLNETNSEEEIEPEREESEYENSSSSSSGSDGSDVDMEDATLDQRFLNSAARGRPSSKLKGKNGFVWNTSVSSRRSGTL